MKNTKKEIPNFENEKEERQFWANHDSEDYIDCTKAETGRFQKLKPTTKSISIRLPQSLIDDLKILANRRDVPYQSLLKVFLAERVDDEFGRHKAS
ncbi:MAG: BrnA antitoxin family protein [Spirochaetia bacterium]